MGLDFRLLGSCRLLASVSLCCSSSFHFLHQVFRENIDLHKCICYTYNLDHTRIRRQRKVEFQSPCAGHGVIVGWSTSKWCMSLIVYSRQGTTSCDPMLVRLTGSTKRRNSKLHRETNHRKHMPKIYVNRLRIQSKYESYIYRCRTY